MTITEFIESIGTELHDRIRHSKDAAECRRLLKEHEQSQPTLYLAADSIGISTNKTRTGLTNYRK